MRELGLLAQVRAARELVHGEARDLDLLAAVAVEVAHLGDGRGLPQQPQEVETALLEAAARGQEAGGPADLALDLLDELLDDGGGALRLLALHGNQRLPAFAVGVVHLDGGIDDQSAADQRHQQGSVLAKQAATLLGTGETKRREALAPLKARAVPRSAADTADEGSKYRQHLPGRQRQGKRGRCRCLYARPQCRHSRLLMYPQGSDRIILQPEEHYTPVSAARRVVSSASAKETKATQSPVSATRGGECVRCSGRDASYLAPPAQNRTGGFPAYGSHLGCVTAKRSLGQG